MSHVLVIGGGAAGMMSAIAAARNGHTVTLFEKNEKCGKKIYITGKGRCNVTNASDLEVIFDNMMSKKVKGLFAVGEVLNVDGDCGGFNLAFCWASSYAAALGIKEYLEC